jgi:hypothetical protein
MIGDIRNTDAVILISDCSAAPAFGSRMGAVVVSQIGYIGGRKSDPVKQQLLGLAKILDNQRSV